MAANLNFDDGRQESQIVGRKHEHFGDGEVVFVANVDGADLRHPGGTRGQRTVGIHDANFRRRRLPKVVSAATLMRKKNLR